METVATLPGGWRPVHTIRLEIEPFAELVAHSESLTGSQVDSPDSCRVKLKSAPVTVLQSQIFWQFLFSLLLRFRGLQPGIRRNSFYGKHLYEVVREAEIPPQLSAPQEFRVIFAN